MIVKPKGFSFESLRSSEGVYGQIRTAVDAFLVGATDEKQFRSALRNANVSGRALERLVRACLDQKRGIG